jgi:hypothetical protein
MFLSTDYVHKYILCDSTYAITSVSDVKTVNIVNARIKLFTIANLCFLIDRITDEIGYAISINYSFQYQIEPLNQFPKY